MLTVFFNFKLKYLMSQESAVGIATGYRLDSQGVGVRVPVGARLFSPCCPDWFWDQPSLLSNGYPRFLSWG
jgi:hypothetical protein